MAAIKNKLPTFGTNADIDENIVNNSSGLKNTGFQPNTTIKSAEMNTYMKMLINGMSGLIDSVYNDGVVQNEIKADSTSEDVKNYIVAGLNQIIKTKKVDNATHADMSKNVDAITNNDSGDNANVKFAIGNKSFSKTVNNVSHATNAEKLDDSAGSATRPVYFSEGKPVAITGNIANGTTGNAATATKLQNARTFNISGDATGTAQSFDGTGNVTIPVDVKKSAALDSTNVGDATHPVYFDASGKPARIETVANAATSANCTGNSATASKLSASRNIALSGDASGSTSFDGSGDATINVSVANSAAAKTVVDSSSRPLNIGDVGTPTYFSSGKPAKLTRTFFNELANPFKSATLTNGYIELSSVGIASTTHTIEVIYNSGSTYSPSNQHVLFGVVSNTRLAEAENEARKLGVDYRGTLMRVTDTGGRLYIEKATSISGSSVSFSNASGTVYVRDLTSYK